MKFLVSALALAASANAHAIMQKLMVNGVDQGSLVGIRAPSSNNPVQDVSSTDLLCGASAGTSSKVITVPAGASVGAAWAHVLGGPQGAGDSDNPIASSHKGPTQVYLAKVSDAASASASGLKWFKIASDGVTTDGVWGVDHMIANTDASGFGWQKFTMPSCIAPGQYLMRVELLALHSAGSQGGAQFYQSCAQIQVTGSGSFSPAASNQIALPSGYSAADPGILVNIYDNSGKPTANGKYTAPGPAVISCGAGSAPVSSAAAAPVSSTAPKPATSVVAKPVTSAAAPATTAVNSKPTTLVTIVKTTTAAAAPAPTPATGSATAARWGQCGGNGWTGPTTCASGSTCQVQNPYYSQCL
ncbi:hypothetical protein H2203_000220 [Taxawa tesnikishii (nom. ined.)]|nr:hypothetical protein H2203_000220 [Dothideales sp. JES 119]